MSDHVMTPKKVMDLTAQIEAAIHGKAALKISTLREVVRAIRWASDISADAAGVLRELDETKERAAKYKTLLGMVAQGFTLINTALEEVPSDMGGVRIVTEETDSDTEAADVATE